MKRSQLREAIKSILQKKLNEQATDQRGQQLAASLEKMLSGGEDIRQISIQTHHGDEPLEIVEWWANNGVLHIGVIADRPKLQEIAPATTSTGNPVVPSVRPDDQQDQLDRMTDAEKKQIENAQKEQEKLTNDIRRIEGGIQKLREPVERKISALEKAKASKERKLGTITSKITNIQRKYSKV